MTRLSSSPSRSPSLPAAVTRPCDEDSPGKHLLSLLDANGDFELPIEELRASVAIGSMSRGLDLLDGTRVPAVPAAPP